MAQSKSIKVKTVRVRPIPKVGGRRYKALGEEIFPELYSNIFLCARKKSGKTVLIYNILKRCANRKTTVLFFVPTIYKDDSYKQIRAMLDKKGIKHLDYQHFIEGKTNLLDEFIREVETPGDPDVDDGVDDGVDDDGKQSGGSSGDGRICGKIPKEECKILWGGEKTREELLAEQERREIAAAKKAKKRGGKKKRLKTKAPQYIIVFDDLGQDLRNKSIATFLKKNRHLKAKVIMSSQWLHDVHPQGIRQLDYMIAFKNFTDDKLLHMYRQLDISTPFEDFVRYYKYATSKPYGFLWIDCVKDKFRSGFNERLN